MVSKAGTPDDRHGREYVTELIARLSSQVPSPGTGGFDVDDEPGGNGPESIPFAWT